MFAKLAFLNLWRRKSRTVIVIAMIAICLAGLMFMQGLYDGWMDEIIEHIIKSDGGRIVVQKKGYRLSRLLEDRLTDSAELAGRIAGQTGVKRVGRRIVIDGMAATGRSSQGAMLVGVEPDEFITGHLAGYLTEGRSPAAARMPEAVITADFARKLKTSPGKKLVLTAQGLDKEITGMAVRVVGIIRTYNMFLDRNAVFIDYETMDRAFGMAGAATRITVELANPDTTSASAAALRQLLGPEREVLTWRQRYPSLDYSVEAMVYFNLVHYAIIFIVVAIGITDIILISVLERVREFGIMMALGTRFRTISAVILLESALLGFFGFVLGSAAGMAILTYFHRAGLDLSAFSEGLQYYAMPSIMHADLRLEYLLYAFISVAVASTVSACIPIWILRRRKPVQSITMT